MNRDSNINNLISQLSCLKCGTRENLVPYNVSYSEHVSSQKVSRRTTRHTYNVHSVPVPICTQCKRQLDKWNRTKTLLILLIIAGFFPFWPSLIFLLPFLSNPSDKILQILGISIGISIMALGSFFYFLHKKKDTNPNLYMMMGPDLMPIVNPRNQAWMKYEDWIRSFQGVQKMIFLPKSSEQTKPKTIPKESDKVPKFIAVIDQYLKENNSKVFTARAIVNRITERLTDESDKDFLKNNIGMILKRLSLKNRIDVIQREGEFYYCAK